MVVLMDKLDIGLNLFFVSVGSTPAGTICHLSRNVLILILGEYPRYSPIIGEYLGYTPTTQVVIPVKLPDITGGYLHIESYRRS